MKVQFSEVQKEALYEEFEFLSKHVHEECRLEISMAFTRLGL